MQKKESMLQAEIEFWRYMIKSRNGAVSDQATERMLHACQLAERKLMMIETGPSPGDQKELTSE